MSDVQDLLDRKARRFVPAPQGWERLLARQRRRERFRRAGTAALALVIAAVGSFGAYAAFNGTEAPQPAATGADFYALWPERSLDHAAGTQQRVDGGEEQEQWRLDPEETTRRFARDVLGWEDVRIIEMRCPPPGCGPTLEDGTIMAVAAADVSPPAAESAAPFLEVRLERLVRHGEGGIWSVTAINGRSMSLPFQPGEDVGVPATFKVPTTLPDGAPAEAHYEHGDPVGCRGGRGRSLVVRDRAIPLRLDPEDPQVAAASDFPQAPDGAEAPGGEFLGCSFGGGDPLRRAVPAIVYIVSYGGSERRDSVFEPEVHGVRATDVPVVDLAAVPVRFVPSDASTGERADARCSPPTFRATYLPWLPVGAPIPDPVPLRETDDPRDAGLVWQENPQMPAQGGRVVLTTLYVKPDVKPWRELTVTMHGHEAALQWVGEPGSGDITATWTERPGACGSYRLRLTDDDFHEARSLRELFRLGDTLDERDPDPSGMRAVWPEVDPGRLRAIQDELEVGGNEELAWLLDPDETAQRAVEETLGVTVVAVHLLEESSGIQTYLVRDRTGHEERVSVYRPSLGAGELIWIVLRVDGSTTIESVDVREDGKTVVRGTAPANALVGGRVRRACPQEPACPPLAEFSYDRATLGGRYEVVVDDPDPRRPGAVDVVLHGRGAQAFRDWTAIWIPPGFQELDLRR